MGLSVTSRPILRRVIAAIILLAFAVGSVMFWNRGAVDPIQLGINLGLATLGMVWLHLRWRKRERRELTPSKVKDIFS